MNAIRLKVAVPTRTVNALGLVVLGLVGAGLVDQGYGEFAVALLIGVGLAFGGERLYRFMQWQEQHASTTPGYESKQVKQLPIPCGRCGTRRPWGELRPDTLYGRVCPRGQCLVEQSLSSDVA